MKTILCYGDSNTWGYDPKNQCRHDHKTRWPMALKNILNKDTPPDEPCNSLQELCKSHRHCNRFWL